MSDINTLTVEQRDRVGKGSSRAARRAGRIPAVIYGDGRPPASVTVSRRDLDKAIQSGGFFNKLIALRMDDNSQQVLPREVQVDVVTDVPLHVDFFRISSTAELTIDVPVVFINEEDCDGLRQGGVLNIVRHEIEVTCLASAIPETIECDLTGLVVGDSLHISAVTLPDGVVPTITDRDFTIATIAAPTIAIVEVEEEVEGLEEGAEALAEGEEAPAAEGEDAPSED